MMSSKPARNMQRLIIEINWKQIVHPIVSYYTNFSDNIENDGFRWRYLFWMTTELHISLQGPNQTTELVWYCPLPIKGKFASALN